MRAAVTRSLPEPERGNRPGYKVRCVLSSLLLLHSRGCLPLLKPPEARRQGGLGDGVCASWLEKGGERDTEGQIQGDQHRWSKKATLMRSHLSWQLKETEAEPRGCLAKKHLGVGKHRAEAPRQERAWCESKEVRVAEAACTRRAGETKMGSQRDPGVPGEWQCSGRLL